MKTVVSGSCPSFSRPSYEGPSVDPHGSSSIAPRYLTSAQVGRTVGRPRTQKRPPAFRQTIIRNGGKIQQTKSSEDCSWVWEPFPHKQVILIFKLTVIAT